MAAFTPTSEQRAVLEAYERGGNVRVTACAGAGKSSTLRLIAEAHPDSRFLYLAFNSAIAREAAATFPSNVQARTAHSVAFASVGRQYKHRLDAPPLSAAKAARRLGLNDAYWEPTAERKVTPTQQASLVNQMVTRFCQSADTQPALHHMPIVRGLDTPQTQRLAAHLMPYARKAWADLLNPQGTLRYTHGAYLKQFSLLNPDLGFPVILYDEAQDAAPVIASIVRHQQTLGARVVVVGDSAQAIYGFTGARNAMDSFAADHDAVLSQSFRFGPAIADAANQWLTVLDNPIAVRGTPTRQSTVGPLPAGEKPDAVLCRTNVGVISEAITLLSEGVTVAISGGTKELRALAEAAEALIQGRPSNHPDLVAFETWAQVQEYAASDDGTDMRPLVKLIDTYGPAAILRALDQIVSDPQHAQVTVSTAHKAKGLEWDRVRISDDFMAPPGGAPSRQELMLAYVAATRARTHLDMSALDWVHRLVRDGVRAEPDRLELALPAPSPSAAVPATAPAPTAAEPPAPLTPAVPAGDRSPIHVVLMGADAASIKARASTAGVTPSEWVRRALHASVQRDEPFHP